MKLASRKEEICIVLIEMTKNVEQMKNSQFDILVDLDKRVQVDIEMKVIVDRLELRERLTYYLTRMHGSQDLKGEILL